MKAAVRRAAAALAGVLVVLGLLVAGGGPAWAAGDSYDRFDVAIAVTEDGRARVTETIVFRFGSDSGRRGIFRDLVTREPWGNDQDAVYGISDIDVTSPTPDVSHAFTVSRDDAGRERSLRIRVGDPNRRVSSPTATYVISYTLTGGLRTEQASGNRPEFYWDVLGPGLARVDAARVTVAVPGGAQSADCYAGPVKGSEPCTTAAVDGSGRGVYTQEPLESGDILTVSAVMAKTAVTDAVPTLVPAATGPEQGSSSSQPAAPSGLLLGVGGVGALAIPFLGWLYYRRRGRDERFAGMPPGTFPPAGSRVGVVTSDPDMEIPVAFSPPKLPLTHAGYLLEGRFEVTHLTATLVGLATSGAIRLDSGDRPIAYAREASRAPDAPSALLYRMLFDEADVVAFDQPGEMDNARTALEAEAHDTAVRQGWFKRVLAGRRSGSALSMAWLVFAAFAFLNVSFSGWMLWVLIPVTVSLLLTAMIVRRKTARGQRTATGRAWTDQIEGFRTYLATAEADQLRFEEGEDIFSRYLPWAILFGLAERWVQVCEKAVQLGLLNEPDLGWYGGVAFDANWLLWNLHMWDTSVSTAAMPPAPVPDTSSFNSGLGFGGGSGFGGGGFSGGGGGGGGGGSW